MMRNGRRRRDVYQRQLTKFASRVGGNE